MTDISCIMRTKTINLFIIEDDPKMGADLRKYLVKKFGDKLSITNFLNGESALRKVNKATSIVILDDEIDQEISKDVLLSIKNKNPETKVIILSSNEKMDMQIDSVYNDTTEYRVKNEKPPKRLIRSIKRLLDYPIQILTHEFSISRYLAIFIVSFVSIGVCLLFLKLF